MGSVKDYFSSLWKGVASLVKGLEVTGKEFVTPKITERYPCSPVSYTHLRAHETLSDLVCRLLLEKKN